VWWVNEKPFPPRVILRNLCWSRKRNGGCAATKMELCPLGSRAVAGTQQGTCWTEGIIAPGTEVQGPAMFWKTKTHLGRLAGSQAGEENG